jgi:hypothetical protein
MKLKLLKITQSNVDSLTRRILTMFNGKTNTVTSVQYGAYGEDTNPVKNSIGIYSDTELDGKEVCLGIMNKNAKAELGERRLYCTDANGNFKFNIWLRADGTVLIGDSEAPASYVNYFVKYNELNAASQAQNTAINLEFTKIAAAINAIISGLYTPVVINLDISASQADKVKTI